jgi:cell division protein ZipA
LAAELRWILLGLSLVLLVGIWWWGGRRSGQAAGNAELRESTSGRSVDAAPSVEPEHVPQHEVRDWGVPPFEPLSIRTREFDSVPILDEPMMVDTAPLQVEDFEPEQESAATHEPVAEAPATAEVPGRDPENSDRFAAAAPQAPNVAQLQRILTIRVCCSDDTLWSGATLMAALETHGLSYGRYQVFHRKHVDGRSLFCVASLIEPGTFDIAGMPENEFRGVTLFAVLPGPIEPLDTLDELFATARGLAEELSGDVQDAKGMPLSAQRAAAMREDIARFQAQLNQG